MPRKINPRLAPFYSAPKWAECLYAIELSNGLVKVGKSGQPQERLAQHVKANAERGVRLLRFVVVRIPGVSLRCIWEAEKQLLARMDRVGQRIAPKHETFMGVRFGVAANLVRQIAPREFIDYIPTRSAA